jgi:hypothetical protein
MSAFSPFHNDSQVVTITTGEDELSLENGFEDILLSGTAIFKRGDSQSKAALAELQRQLAAIARALD